VAPERRAALRNDIAANIAFARAKVERFDRERAEELAEYGEYEPGPQELQWRRHGEGATPWVCLLVSRDHSAVDVHPWTYPLSNLWNAYSPFRAISETSVEALTELRAIILPPDIEP
jgi:hypothetical protein